MADTTAVACGCGRTMQPDALRGAGAYRCGCGARVKVTKPEPRAHCAWHGCRLLPVRNDEPVPLCEEHTAEWRRIWFPEETRIERFTRLGLICDCTSKDLKTLAAAAEKYDREQGEKAARSVVYYIRSGDLVKIGVTVDLPTRIKSFNVPGLVVLGTEPGDQRLERQRHIDFADDWVQGEWFQLSDRIKAHIAEVRGADDGDAVLRPDRLSAGDLG
jgi:hypothetical protein